MRELWLMKITEVKQEKCVQNESLQPGTKKKNCLPSYRDVYILFWQIESSMDKIKETKWTPDINFNVLIWHIDLDGQGPFTALPQTRPDFIYLIFILYLQVKNYGPNEHHSFVSILVVYSKTWNDLILPCWSAYLPMPPPWV